MRIVLGTFRFENEDDYDYEIWLKVFSHIFKINTPRKASCYHFSLEKLASLSLVKEVTRSPDRKMIKHSALDILFSLPRFPAKMTLVHARALLSIEKISYS